MTRKQYFSSGLKDGMPICFGYFAVSFAFGIQAAGIGLSVFEASVLSALNVTSAGQFAALAIIASGASLIELAFTQLIINLRYFLMSCALSQKLSPSLPLGHRLGIAYETGFGVTGVKARLAGAGHRRTVALLGELDAIVCREHPMSDPVTGAAHCCGHNVQIANLVAVAMAVKDVDAMKYLGGDLVLFAVPAEEYVEIEYRNKLREEKKIEFLGGKAQIIAEGGFDDVDMALQMHVDPATHPEGNFQVGNTSNGFIGKLITYRGKAAHAAGAPDKGVNALNACMMGVMGVNAIRETFREDDCVRFHPIINSGGDLVNVIPDYVKMESYVRASNLPAMKDVNARINRALQAGAMALGAECDIHDLAGYLPMKPDENFRAVLRRIRDGRRTRRGLHRHGRRLAPHAGRPSVGRLRLGRSPRRQLPSHR